MKKIYKILLAFVLILSSLTITGCKEKKYVENWCLIPNGTKFKFGEEIELMFAYTPEDSNYSEKHKMFFSYDDVEYYVIYDEYQGEEVPTNIVTSPEATKEKDLLIGTGKSIKYTPTQTGKIYFYVEIKGKFIDSILLTVE